MSSEFSQLLGGRAFSATAGNQIVGRNHAVNLASLLSVYAAFSAAFLILDRSNTAAFSQLRQAFSRSRASSYQTMSRCLSGGLFAPTILRIFVESCPIAVPPLNCRYHSPRPKSRD